MGKSRISASMMCADLSNLTEVIKIFEEILQIFRWIYI